MSEKHFFVAGVDIGAATAKSVILDAKEMIASHVMPTGHSVAKAAETVMQESLAKTHLTLKQIRHIISTGYGRRAVSFADAAVTEISCHAKGVHSLIPDSRTVIDVGGQDSKVIGIDSNGTIGNFVMNDKCAAGTGRFLEVMAKVLNTDIEEIGTISLQGYEPCQISNTCTVFAESEMVTLRAEGQSRENLFSGIHSAMAHRIAIMGKSVGFHKQVVFTGGVAKNAGMKKALEDKIGMEIIVPKAPQIMGALGAAILANERVDNT